MSLRTTRFASLLTRAAARAPSTTLRPLLGASSTQVPSQSSRQIQPFPLPISNQVQTRDYALGATTGKSQGDLLVDELQELYPSPILTIPPSPHQTLKSNELTPNKDTKLQKTNSKSQPTAPTTPPSTPPPTATPAATP